MFMHILFIYYYKIDILLSIFMQYINKNPKTLINGGIKIPLNSFKSEIVFKDITFSYPTRPEQVRKLRFVQKICICQIYIYLLMMFELLLIDHIE